MLDPRNRQLLRDVLRPPSGFELDRAVVTTYSVDLMAVLTVPLAFTFFQIRDQAGTLSADPLALLEALRRHSRHLTIFCQAGQIHLPKNVQLLLGYVESAIHEVTSPRGGVFHPKVAVLRYVVAPSATFDDGAERDAVLYRVLCSSRNLTFDRSWDTMLVLDGKLSRARQKAYASNRPLSRFVQELPKLLLHQPADPQQLAHVTNIADELLRVNFEVPEGFDELEFCPIGVPGGTSWPTVGYGRTLVVAPFVNDEFLRRLTAAGGEHHLVSRQESLDELSEESIGSTATSYYMNTAAEPVNGEATDPDPEPNEPPNAVAPSNSNGHEIAVEPSLQLSGLHEKLFICDDGWNTDVWTGSANATSAAFEKNVEFLIRLRGKKSRCGVSDFLSLSDKPEDARAADRGVSFGDFLLKYVRNAPPAIDVVQKRLEDELERARTILATSRLTGIITRMPAGPERYELQLRMPDGVVIEWPASVTVTCSPITLRDAYKALQPPISKSIISFGPLSFDALTTFVGFRLSAREATREVNCGFVLNVPLVGMPADREGRILLSLLRNRQQLLRYLLMLLADDADAAASVTEMLENDRALSNNSGNGNSFGLPLLEPLLRALDRQPGRLHQMFRLIEDLRATPEGAELVTEEFLQIWQPIWDTAKALGKERATP
jgi:hypothetical protein